jgi:hypothetical protein
VELISSASAVSSVFSRARKCGLQKRFTIQYSVLSVSSSTQHGRSGLGPRTEVSSTTQESRRDAEARSLIAWLTGRCEMAQKPKPKSIEVV